MCLAGAAQLPSRSPLALTGASATATVTFAAGGGLQQEVRFAFKATAIATAQVTLQATLGGATDGLQLEVPVLGERGA